MASKAKQAVLNTLIYADIFDTPLSADEVFVKLVKNKTSLKNVKDILNTNRLIKSKNKFYFLKGREKIVKIKKERIVYSREKLVYLYRILPVLEKIPFIKFIGVSGAVAAKNSRKEDDIDLFIITDSNRLWTARFLITLMLDMFKLRRTPKQEQIDNKLCLNMFVDFSNITIDKENRNLYTAYEIQQLKPLISRGKCYEIFIYKNRWVKKFLPNFSTVDKILENLDRNSVKSQILNNKKEKLIGINILKFIEYCFFKTQLVFMRKKITSEVVKKDIIRFHPGSRDKEIMKVYRENVTRLSKSR